MTASTPGQRKAALLLATLGWWQRRRIVSSLPRQDAEALQPLVRHCRRRGWQPADIEAALAGHRTEAVGNGEFSDRQWLRIASQLAPERFARVLLADDQVDRARVIASLPAPYAAAVAGALPTTPAPPAALAMALLAEAGRRAQGSSQCAD